MGALENSQRKAGIYSLCSDTLESVLNQQRRAAPCPRSARVAPPQAQAQGTELTGSSPGAVPRAGRSPARPGTSRSPGQRIPRDQRTPPGPADPRVCGSPGQRIPGPADPPGPAYPRASGPPRDQRIPRSADPAAAPRLRVHRLPSSGPGTRASRALLTRLVPGDADRAQTLLEGALKCSCVPPLPGTEPLPRRAAGWEVKLYLLCLLALLILRFMFSGCFGWEVRPKGNFWRKVHYWCCFSWVQYRLQVRDALLCSHLTPGDSGKPQWPCQDPQVCRNPQDAPFSSCRLEFSSSTGSAQRELRMRLARGPLPQGHWTCWCDPCSAASSALGTFIPWALSCGAFAVSG